MEEIEIVILALSKTGGKLITIDIDEARHNTALANLAKAGLTSYVEARLADAHQLVKQLKGTLRFRLFQFRQVPVHPVL